MVDIAMCNNTKCPQREECYRFNADPGMWQAFGDFGYDEEQGCDHFILWEKEDD
jgi:hypothetical protein